MTAELKSTSHGQTMVLTISNPDHRNALGPEIYAAGVEALTAADSNPEVRSVVITGDGLVGVAERFLRKGSKVYLEGSLRTRKWQDQQGNDRYSTEVALAGPGAVLTMLDGAPVGEKRKGYSQGDEGYIPGFDDGDDFVPGFDD